MTLNEVDSMQRTFILCILRRFFKRQKKAAHRFAGHLTLIQAQFSRWSESDLFDPKAYIYLADLILTALTRSYRIYDKIVIVSSALWPDENLLCAAIALHCVALLVI